MEELNPSGATAADLSKETERIVARRFMGRIQWEMILIGLGQTSLWLINWWLVLGGYYSLFVGFLIATLCSCMAYLPSHEGQHGNLSGRKKKWRWIDSFVGAITLIPLATSHVLLKVTHMKHHAYTNDPLRDVDINSSGERWWHAAIGVQKGVPPDLLKRHAEEDAAFALGLEQGIPVVKAYGAIQLLLVFFFPLETLFLWWLPRKISLSYLAVFFSWYPHFPGGDIGRYRDTRFWRVPIPRYLCQSMQTHVIHHMYPSIPHWEEPRAMEALKPFMIERGVEGAEDIPDRVRFNPLIST